MKLTPFLLLATSSILAASTIDHRISKLEQQMDEVWTRTVYGNGGAKTVSATPGIDRYGPFVSIEVLCFKPFIGGTEFAYTDIGFPVTSPYFGSVEQIDFNWRCGIRSTLGYQFCQFDWALYGEYTWVRFSQTEHVPHPSSALGLPDVNNETGSESGWKIGFNVFDIDLARPYFLRPRFSVSPRIGIRTAWISQRDHAQYFNASNSVSNLLKYVNNTAGVGILTGGEMRWHWSSDWSLASNVVASLIYGKMKVDAKVMNFLTTPAVPLNISADTYKFLPNMGVDTALTWEHSWCHVRLSLTAGYEFQYWWRQNQRPHLEIGTAYSWTRLGEDLGIQGFKFKSSLDF